MRTLLEIQREFTKKYHEETPYQIWCWVNEVHDHVHAIIDDQLCEPAFRGLFIQ